MIQNKLSIIAIIFSGLATIASMGSLYISYLTYSASRADLQERLSIDINDAYQYVDVSMKEDKIDVSPFVRFEVAIKNTSRRPITLEEVSTSWYGIDNVLKSPMRLEEAELVKVPLRRRIYVDEKTELILKQLLFENKTKSLEDVLAERRYDVYANKYRNLLPLRDSQRVGLSYGHSYNCSSDPNPTELAKAIQVKVKTAGETTYRCQIWFADDSDTGAF